MRKAKCNGGRRRSSKVLKGKRTHEERDREREEEEGHDCFEAFAYFVLDVHVYDNKRAVEERRPPIGAGRRCRCRLLAVSPFSCKCDGPSCASRMLGRRDLNGIITRRENRLVTRRRDSLYPRRVKPKRSIRWLGSSRVSVYLPGSQESDT